MSDDYDPDNTEYTYAETISWLNKRISELEKTMMDIKDDIPKFSAKKWDESYHSINHFIGKVEELKERYENHLVGEHRIFERTEVNKEVLRDVISLTVPNHLKKQLLEKLDSPERTEKKDWFDDGIATPYWKAWKKIKEEYGIE